MMQKGGKHTRKNTKNNTPAPNKPKTLLEWDKDELVLILTNMLKPYIKKHIEIDEEGSLFLSFFAIGGVFEGDPEDDGFLIQSYYFEIPDYIEGGTTTLEAHFKESIEFLGIGQEAIDNMRKWIKSQ